MPKYITFIRHAQSIFNSGEETNPALLINCPLSNFGIEQSKKLNLHFDILIMSPLKRAIQTYANSNIKTKEIIISPYIREQIRGESTWLDFENNLPYESIDDMRKRIKYAMNNIYSLKHENIGVISHGDFLRELFLVEFKKNVHFTAV